MWSASSTISGPASGSPVIWRCRGRTFATSCSTAVFARLLAEFESGRIAPEAFAASVMELSGVRAPLRRVRPGVGRHLLAERVHRAIDRVPEIEGVFDLSRVEHESPACHVLPPRVRPDARPLRWLHPVLRGRPPEAGAEFFDACVRAAGVPAASCIFIDDIAENVEGARQAGLTALHYVDTPALMEDLRRAGVEVPGGER